MSTDTVLSSQEEAVFRLLFQLQESGETNMFDAPKYVMRDPRFSAIPISEVRALRDRWMSEWEVLRRQLKIGDEEAAG